VAPRQGSAVPEGWLHAGTVGRPHGLDGSFHVIRPTPQLLLVDAVVRIGGHEATITRRAGTDARPILRLSSCEERTCAETMRGQELLVPREQAPELEPDEWWAADLEGCAVLDEGRRIGTVRRLLALPSCEVLEVVRADGSELLVPLVADAVLTVDVERRRIEIDVGFLGEE
jgi:16S rRNA processing protein RimM